MTTDVMRDGRPVTGFADDAKVENGYLKLPDRPGIGFEAQNALYSVMREVTAVA